MQSLLQQNTFIAYGGLLGFPCFHTYEFEEQLPTTEQLNRRDLIGAHVRLRGADAILAVVGAQAGFVLSLWR